MGYHKIEMARMNSRFWLRWEGLWNNRLGEKSENEKDFVSGNVKFVVSIIPEEL